MDRTEIITRFREDNPEITDRVITDTVLKSWLIVGNLEFATKARMISTINTFNTVEDIDQYDLTSEIPKFFDIDEWPGGGVAYDAERITQTSRSELDSKVRSWRSYSSGTPKKYYRRNQYIYFERPPDEVVEVTVDAIIKPDDFDDDAKTPFNELSYLEPYHYGLVLYLTMRAKGKVGKSEEFSSAYAEYMQYINDTKKTIRGNRIDKIQIVPSQHFPGSIYR